MKEIMGMGLLVIVVIFLFGSTISSKIKSYGYWCEHEVAPVISVNECRKISFPLNRQTFEIDKKNQRVISWFDDGSPIRTNDCAIRDRRNWSCTYDDGSGSFGFNSGIAWSSDQFEKGNHVFYVSRWMYYAKTLGLE